MASPDGPLASALDETEQWGSGTADGEPRYRNAQVARAGADLSALSDLPHSDSDGA